MTSAGPTTPNLAEIMARLQDRKLPPVDKWNPDFCGDIDMRIARDGTWYYMGSPIGRKPMVKLFSTVIRRDDDKYFLVTPVEKLGIVVDDAPFVAVEADIYEPGPAQSIVFRTNVDDEVIAGPDNPIRVEIDPETDEPSPYVLVRKNLWALIARPVFYQLVDAGEEREVDGKAMLGISSRGRFFVIGGLDAAPLNMLHDLFRGRLLEVPNSVAAYAPASDYDLTPHIRDGLPPDRTLRAAAVLVPVIDREEGPTVLLTQRTDHLSSHAGQVAFPGGRVDDTDNGPVDTALRETWEEIGLDRSFIEVIGALDTYETGTGFSITPIVGLVRPGFTLTLQADEVALVFEVPLDFFLDPANHQRESREWRGAMRHYYVMPYDGHHIWGATAGMLVNLYNKLRG